MSTGENLLDDTRSLINEEDEGIWTDKEIMRWLNQAQRITASRIRFRQRRVLIPVTAGVQSYDLSSTSVYSPTGTAHLKNMQHNIERIDLVEASKTYMLDRMDQYSHQTSQLGTAGTRRPQRYNIFANVLYLDTIPSVSASMYVYFVDTNMTDMIASTQCTLPQDIQHLLPLFAAARCKQKDDEFEQAANYQGEFDSGLAAYVRDMRGNEDRNFVPQIQVTQGYPGDNGGAWNLDTIDGSM